jgi:hypothetical protein
MELTNKGKKRSKYQPTEEQLQALRQIQSNVVDPHRWAIPDELLEVVRIPSLRGMVYGYVAEYEFTKYLREELEILEYDRDDDHKKTKSDLNFVYQGRRYSVQVKCLQTTLIRPVDNDKFKAVAQNDASDRRVITLPNGDKVNTTCYVAGEYDILVSTVQPFVGEWKFIFKKNKDLRRSTYKGYTEEQRRYLLASQEIIMYPIEPDSGWTYDLISLLSDPDLGNVHIIDSDNESEKYVVDIPDSEQSVIVETKKAKRKPTS